jgi:histidinol-phosphate/aromatic aminotransferase/cobyric acid decarboxylase-like protein
MLTLTKKENKIAEKLKELKRASGSHSPNKFTMLREIPELRIKVDACFLSNPYANDLFLEYLNRDVISAGKLPEIIETYPSQNRAIAEHLAKHLGVNPKNLFIGAGAIEIIQALLHRFVKGKLLVTIPTFSSYYEFALPETKVIFHHLKKENDFKFDTAEFIKIAKNQKVDSVVIINPNNPDGGYIPHSDILRIAEELKNLDNFIIDESFIHFASEGDASVIMTAESLVEKYPNLVIIKSMSKDFGVAGIRAGYGVMAEEKVSALLKNGYLWNVSGLAEYFFEVYAGKDFSRAYEKVRKNYIETTQEFFKQLSAVPGLKTYPSQANFALVELTNGLKSEDAVLKLLIAKGIHLRDCGDKIGLSGEFIRVASRTVEENKLIVSAFKKLFIAS